MTDPDRYDLVLSPGARRALTEDLPPAAAFACWEFIDGPLRANPRRVGAPLREPFAGLWRARRGEYRVRYEIDDERHRVLVLDIDHRRSYLGLNADEGTRDRAVASGTVRPPTPFRDIAPSITLARGLTTLDLLDREDGR